MEDILVQSAAMKVRETVLNALGDIEKTFLMLKDRDG